MALPPPSGADFQPPNVASIRGSAPVLPSPFPFTTLLPNSVVLVTRTVPLHRCQSMQ